MKVRGREPPRLLSRADSRARPARAPLAGRAALLHEVRQRCSGSGIRRWPASRSIRTHRRSTRLCPSPPRSSKQRSRMPRPGSTCRAARATSVIASGPKSRSRTGTSAIVSGARERRDAATGVPRGVRQGRAARLPKIALPTRTIVAPSRIAASRSALIPAESVSSARPVGAQCVCNSSRSARCGARCASRSRPRRLRDRHQAAQPQAAAARRRRGRRRATSPGATPLFWSLAADVDLQADLQRRQVRRPLRAQPLRRSSARSIEWTQSKRSATTRVLLLCSGPIRCHSGRWREVGERGDLVERFLDVVLAEAALAGRMRCARSPRRRRSCSPRAT